MLSITQLTVVGKGVVAQLIGADSYIADGGREESGGSADLC